MISKFALSIIFVFMVSTMLVSAQQIFADSFTMPQNISNTGFSRIPSIATDGTSVLVAWYDDSSGNNEILFSKSTNGGTTWSTPQNISNTAKNSLSPYIATDGTNILVTWRDNSGNSEILFSKSTDGGTTWSAPQNISNNPAHSDRPSIATDGTNILVTWTDFSLAAGNSEILFSKSMDDTQLL